MKKRDMRKSWIPMRDYLLDGVRKERDFSTHFIPDESMQALPEGWISARDYLINGVRKSKRLSKENESFIQLNKQQEFPSLPPEVLLTVFDSLAEVYTIVSDSSILLKVEQIYQSNRKDVESGIISEEELQRRSAILEEIKGDYLTKIDDLASWYLDNFFHVFGASDQDDIKNSDKPDEDRTMSVSIH